MSNNALISDFLKLYNQLDKSNLELLNEVYADNIIFEDPLHRIEGLPALTDYFANMYENLNQGQFEIHTSFEQDDQASVYWVMTFSHKKIKQGQSLKVNGNTYLEFENGKVVYHRDYFDAGEMIYQHLPVFGTVINLIKRRTAA
ncbi:transcriptional regulator [Pseudoalteromonas phenolica]|uniref:Transcriptional regulator n=1 Tax=Pseudoalteromonas phenolica TaxID=161398 RepID=A0A4Q7IUA2_9GAMM|nr:nuclear transport factor 2 family protein [Pseudoalteromonas phenolica]RZQ54867.1 transcriptional regulator [Pseudoalteromonas phenolica]TMN92876.1 transcriptional regulator [Pseudoalteromonas phenolica]TMP82297.1 transcriptional regulator [Pseudoalteromonas phenolica]